MDEEIIEIVCQHGWYAASDHNSPFLYTVLPNHRWFHPEFVMFGLEPD